MSTTLDLPLDMRGAFVRTMSELLDTDPSVALVLADISADQFLPELRKYPERVLNVGIREQLLISVAGGLALTGLRPIAHTYAPFLVERPFEQIKLDLVHQDAGAILVSVGASYDWPAGGRTHQSPGDVALLDTLPGVRVHVPGHPDDAARLLRTEAGRDGVAYLRLSAAVNAQPQPGSGLRLVRPGRRGLVIAVGPMLDPVLDAAKALSAEGIHVAVAYLDTVRPFDGAGLRAALAGVATPEVVLVEPYLAGTSSHVVSQALTGRAHRLLSLGVRRDAELRVYGDAADHDRAHGLDSASLAVEVLAFLASRHGTLTS
jgi:transketolase